MRAAEHRRFPVRHFHQAVRVGHPHGVESRRALRHRATMTFIRQAAATAPRRRNKRTIRAITPMRTATPMRIHSQRRLEPDPFAGSVALALGCTAGVGAAEVVGADEVTDGTAELELGAAEGLELVAGAELVLWVGEEPVVWPDDRLGSTLLMLLLRLELHAVVVPAAPRIVAARSRLAIGRRINGPFPHL